jgi:hypothetical protein
MTENEKMEYDIKPGADLKGANLSGSILFRANLSRAILSRANLSGSKLSRASLFGADLSRADLTGANLSRAILSRADLTGANLSSASLFGADLSRADLTGANLSSAVLRGANLMSAKGIISIGPSSDGYMFYGVKHDTCIMLQAGCRWFSNTEAKNHWKTTRANTPLGKERLLFVEFIENYFNGLKD